MVYRRGKKKGNFSFKFVLHGVRVRESAKTADADEASNREAERRAELAAVAGVSGTTEERAHRIEAYLADERAREEAQRESAKKPKEAPAPPLTFKIQAEKWYADVQVRHREPVKPATLFGWRHILNKWALPTLGDRPLSDGGNALLKDLVAKMNAAGKSPKTVVNYSQVVKLVFASAADEKGNQLFPCTWNHKFCDMPIIKKREQRTPSVSQDQVETILAKAKPRRWGVLFALLAGTGLRIGEALALKPSDFSVDRRVLNISRSIWKKNEQEPKTENALRPVDLPEPLSRLLAAHTTDLDDAMYLFKTADGKPLSQRNVLRALHNTGQKVGLHAFRRFRAEVLRMAPAPEDLIRLWLGHANKSVTDDYVKALRGKIDWRREWVDKVGLGFSLDTLLGPQEVESVPAEKRKAG